MKVTLRRYPTGHVFAEIGAVPRTVGNITEISRESGWGWSSLAAEGIVYVSGGVGAKLAEQEMVGALRREGFDVDPDAPPRKQAVECVTCGPYGRRGCTACHGLGRVWPEGGVTYPGN